MLLARDGGGGDPAAVVAGGVNGESSPAGADLDDVAFGIQLKLLTDPIQFARGCDFEGFVGVGKNRRRVHHVGVKKQLEQIIAKVVVGGDITRAAAARIAAQRFQPAHQPTTEPRAAGFHAVEQTAVSHQNPHQGNQIVAGPVAIHVGFRRAHRAVGGSRSIEADVVDAQADTQCLFGICRRCAQRDPAHAVFDPQFTVA